MTSDAAGVNGADVMADASQVSAAVDAAVAALEAGDLDTALTKTEVAELYLAAIPSGSKAVASVDWAHEAIAKVREHISKKRAGKAYECGMLRVGVEYREPTT